jgi:multidrug efflux pump subunit AcrA (membrane-fusion protein)
VADVIRRNLRRPWVVMPLVAVIALGGWVVLKPASASSSGSQAPRTVAVTEGTMDRTVSAQGTVAAAQTDDLSFTAAGTVTAVNVVAGQKVTAGQVLATIDSAALESDVSAAQSDLASAQATLADHESAGASSAQLAADRSSVTSASDRLSDAQRALDGAQLVATFDGTVASVDLTVGEQLTSSGTGATRATGTGSGSGRSASNLGSGSTGGLGGGSGANANANASNAGSTASTPQVRVVSTDSYTVKLGVDDTDIDTIKDGQTASVALSTSSANRFGGGGAGRFGGLAQLVGAGGTTGGATGGTANQTTATTQATTTASTATGTVTEVGQIADASSGVASYPVTVAFTDDTGTFNVGATVQVDSAIAQVTDANPVPTFAITTDGTTSTVTVVADGKRSTREVTTGLVSGALTQVTSGLKAGEQVELPIPTGSGNGNGNGVGGTGNGTANQDRLRQLFGGGG